MQDMAHELKLQMCITIAWAHLCWSYTTSYIYIRLHSISGFQLGLLVVSATLQQRKPYLCGISPETNRTVKYGITSSGFGAKSHFNLRMHPGLSTNQYCLTTKSMTMCSTCNLVMVIALCVNWIERVETGKVSGLAVLFSLGMWSRSFYLPCRRMSKNLFFLQGFPWSSETIRWCEVFLNHYTLYNPAW